MTDPKKGDQYVSNLTGMTMKVTGVTKKEITVEVHRRRVDKKTGEVKYEVHERAVPVQLWGLFSGPYGRHAD